MKKRGFFWIVGLLLLSIVGLCRSAREKIDIRYGYQDSEGAVFILHDGHWGAICADYWGMVEADVACREMNFGGAHSTAIPNYIQLHDTDVRVWLLYAHCYGYEDEISRCDLSPWANASCANGKLAGVQCYEYKDPELLDPFGFGVPIYVVAIVVSMAVLCFVSMYKVYKRYHADEQSRVVDQSNWPTGHPGEEPPVPPVPVGPQEGEEVTNPVTTDQNTHAGGASVPCSAQGYPMQPHWHATPVVHGGYSHHPVPDTTHHHPQVQAPQGGYPAQSAVYSVGHPPVAVSQPPQDHATAHPHIGFSSVPPPYTGHLHHTDHVGAEPLPPPPRYEEAEKWN